MKSDIKIKYIILVLLFYIADTNQIYAYGSNKTAEDYNKEIKQLFSENKTDSIKILIDEALKLYPNDTDINRWAGTFFLQRNETDNARYFLIKSIELDYDNFLAKQQLVALEEKSGNISSAICYVNEMLELYPYDQILWKKKIGLYRRIGNDIEADRLLKRLYSIYPNDSIVTNDYFNRLEEVYLEQKKEGNKEEAISTLKNLIKHRSNESSYYLDLGNMQFLEGHSEEAEATISKGLEKFPNDNALIRKKAEIMAVRGKNKEAVELIKKSQARSLYSISDEITVEAARNGNWKDPYTLYGKIYEEKKSDEALEYLIRTSMTREYNNDAIYYLSEYKKKYGTSPEVLYKEYVIYKRTGNKRAALKVLEEYVNLNPTDKDMSHELAQIKADLADELMKSQEFHEATVYLESALKLSDEEDFSFSIVNKLLSCYQYTNKNEKAIALVDSIRKQRDNQNIFVEQKASALHRIGKTDMAISEMENHGKTGSETYEKISLEYVKKLLQDGANRNAYVISKNWTEKVPLSENGLIYATSTSEMMNLDEETDKYISRGRKLFPNETFFILKEAASLYKKKEFQSGIDLLKPCVDSLSGNKEIISAYSAHVEMKAQDYLKEKEADKALSIIEHAKIYDGTNEELFALEGKAYEMKGEYEKAYISYSKYHPETLWVKEYKRKLMNIQNMSYKNTITTDVLNGWYSDGNRTNTIISTSYSRKMKKDYISATLNISNVNFSKNDINETEVISDKTGTQLRVDWGHTYNDRWASVVGFAAANSIFPSWFGQAGGFYTFPKDVEIGVTIGYRRNYTPVNIILNNEASSKNIYNLRISGNVYKELWKINTNCDAFLINKNMYFNLNSQLKYYPTYDRHTHFMLSAGLGTAPEIDFVDKFMPGSFENLNASIGLGGVYMISKNISLGLTASYHHFYNKTKNSDMIDNDESTTKYKNLYDIYAHIIFSF